jgi:hypothetical protein
VLELWVGAEGIREAAPLVAALPDGGRGIRMAMPRPHRVEPDLYFRMAMPVGASWLPRPDFATLLAQSTPLPRLAAIAYADEVPWLDFLTARNFRKTASMRGRTSGRELWLLVRD